jgi:hypothetical protein
MTASRLGYWSSGTLVAIGIAYVIVLVVGFSRHGLREPITDPVLAVMEVLTLLSAPLIVAVMAAVHDRAPTGRKVYGTIALAFATLLAGTTSAVHFIELTAARQLGNSGIVWPSRAYAAELLAWDVFLGLALVAAGVTFESTGPDLRVRRVAVVCGLLCLLGAAGPLTGNIRLQLIGVFGYAVVLPILAFLLVRAFARQSAPDAASEIR